MSMNVKGGALIANFARNLGKAASMFVMLAGAILFTNSERAYAADGDPIRVVGGIGVGYDSAAGGGRRSSNPSVPGIGGGSFGFDEGAPGRGVQAGDGRIF